MMSSEDYEGLEDGSDPDSYSWGLPDAPLVHSAFLQNLDGFSTQGVSWGRLPSAEEVDWVRENAFSREERRAIKIILSGEDALGRLRLLSVHFLNNATCGRLPPDFPASNPLVAIIFNSLQTRIHSVLPHLEDVLFRLHATDPLLETALQTLWTTVEAVGTPSVEACNAMMDQLQALQGRLLPLSYAFPGPSDRITNAVIRVIGPQGLPLVDRRSPPGEWLEAA